MLWKDGTKPASDAAGIGTLLVFHEDKLPVNSALPKSNWSYLHQIEYGGNIRMRKKIIWTLMSLILLLSLVMVSCSSKKEEKTKVGEEEGEVVMTTEKAKEVVIEEEKEEPLMKVPQYGSTLSTMILFDPISFDSGTGGNGGAFIGIVYDQYMVTDWRRGPAGTGVTNFLAGAGAVEDYFQPALAESWEMPELGVWILQIRQNVYWQPVNSEAGRLMNGRQMTADDIVTSLNRLLQAPRSWIRVARPELLKGLTIEKTDPWEVTIITPVDPWSSHNWIIQGGGFNCVYPPEVVEKYGDMETDWKKAVGTGPFMISDYVHGSIITFIKNPFYWETDPLSPGEGNKLPYINTYKQIIMPDVSTQHAAFRTGKIDFLTGLEASSAKPFIQANPDLEYITYMSNTPWVIAMNRIDKNKPFHDVRVRQAMMLATDFEAFVMDYFEGEAEKDVWPVNRQITALYKPLNELPESVQELYRYNPEKARILLNEAGYPDGFKAKVIAPNFPQLLDELSIFVHQWAKVGIELELDVKEMGVYNGINAARSHEDLIYRFLWGTFVQQLYLSGLRGISGYNPSFVNDSSKGTADLVIEKVFNAINDNMFIDNARAYEEYKSLKAYVLEQAYYIVRPTPWTYSFWWLWLKNYFGQGAGFVRFYWIDRELKQSMGY